MRNVQMVVNNLYFYGWVNAYKNQKSLWASSFQQEGKQCLHIGRYVQYSFAMRKYIRLDLGKFKFGETKFRIIQTLFKN